MRIMTSISLLTLIISATDASAACRQANLRGDWHYFSSNVTLNEDLSPNCTLIEDCTFQITALGVARNASCIYG